MGAIAVRAAQAVGYSNAGTVEFLLDRTGQLLLPGDEHPPAGRAPGDRDGHRRRHRQGAARPSLPAASCAGRQDDIQFKGHAIECRINAEDPYNNFLPDAGRITSLTEPTGPGVRLESGIYAGFEVTPYYDSLLAKLVAWGETRAEAILRMRRALEEFRIGGIHTTIPFHQQVMDSTRFQGGSSTPASWTARTAFASRRLRAASWAGLPPSPRPWSSTSAASRP